MNVPGPRRTVKKKKRRDSILPRPADSNRFGNQEKHSKRHDPHQIMGHLHQDMENAFDDIHNGI